MTRPAWLRWWWRRWWWRRWRLGRTRPAVESAAEAGPVRRWSASASSSQHAVRSALRCRLAGANRAVSNRRSDRHVGGGAHSRKHECEKPIAPPLTPDPPTPPPTLFPARATKAMSGRLTNHLSRLPPRQPVTRVLAARVDRRVAALSASSRSRAAATAAIISDFLN